MIEDGGNSSMDYRLFMMEYLAIILLEARDNSSNIPSLVERNASLAFNYILEHCQVYPLHYAATK